MGLILGAAAVAIVATSPGLWLACYSEFACLPVTVELLYFLCRRYTVDIELEINAICSPSAGGVRNLGSSG